MAIPCLLCQAGVTAHSLILAVNDRKVSSIQELEDVFCAIPNGMRATVRYMVLGGSNNVRVQVFRMDRTWSPMRLFTRNDELGLWTWRECASPPASPAPTPEPIPAPIVLRGGPKGRAAAVRRAVASMCRVRFEVSYIVDGVHSTVFVGTGLMIGGGFVIVDRNTVPVAFGDVTLTFGGSLEVPGTVAFLHPTHNVAVVQYDVAMISDTVEPLPISQQPLLGGDDSLFVGLTRGGYTVLNCVVKECVEFSYSWLPKVPRFVSHNADLLRFDQILKDSIGGVFLDRHGHVQVRMSPSLFLGLPHARTFTIFVRRCHGRHCYFHTPTSSPTDRQAKSWKVFLFKPFTEPYGSSGWLTV